MPQAICAVPPGDEAAFLAPLPATALWGVGPKTAEKLACLGLHTIGDIAAWPTSDLAQRFGQHGQDLARRARGLDDRPVVTARVTKSISQETTFAQDVTDRAMLERTLRAQAAEIASKLQQQGLVATTVKLKLRWADFATPTRQLRMRQPTDAPDEIAVAALRLFHQLWQRHQAVRLIGVGVSGLGSPPQQLSLWDVPAPEEVARQHRVQTALRAIQARFGAGVVRRARDLDDV
jgi:DNA polymerase-4